MNKHLCKNLQNINKTVKQLVTEVKIFFAQKKKNIKIILIKSIKCVFQMHFFQ